VRAGAPARPATLTPEVAGYVILLAAQQLAAERSRVSAHAVLLDAAGGVHVERGGAASELEIETVLRALLGDLIALCSSPPPAIRAVTEREPSGDLRALVGELMAALIPINHAAAHRALARLYREARRAEGLGAHLAPPAIAARPEAAEAAPRERRAEPAELDIDVVVESEPGTLAPEMPLPPQPAEAVPPPEALPSEQHRAAPEVRPIPEQAPSWSQAPARDLLAPELPTAAPGIRLLADEASSSDVDAGVTGEAGDGLVLELPPARPRWTETRSDVQQLLAAFLIETRSVDHMLGALREMIGLEVRPRADAPVASEPTGAVPR
jgi:hypothetical protein